MANLKIIVVVLFVVIIAAAVFGAYEMELGPFEEDEDDDDDNGGQIDILDEKPVAIIDKDKSSADVDETINFDGSASYDDESNITSYKWKFGDGDSVDNATANHSWIQAGAYNVSLTVQDVDGYINVTWVWIGINYREDRNGTTNGDTETFDISMEESPSSIYVNTTLENGNSNIGTNNVTVRISFDGTVVDEQTVEVGGGDVIVFTYMSETNLTAGIWTWELVVNDSGINCDLDWEAEIAILYS